MNSAEYYSLTATEKIILELAAEGFTNKEIADKQFVSLDTVKKHLFNAYRKLNAKNKVDALRKAGLI